MKTLPFLTKPPAHGGDNLCHFRKLSCIRQVLTFPESPNMAMGISTHTKLIVFACVIAAVCMVAGCGGVSSNGGPTPDPTPTAATPTGYLTWKNNNQRTGLQPNETILTPANVNATQFGQKFAVPVDGWAYAQPLYVAGVTIAGAKHNVVFVATEHATIFAFDADAAGPPLWVKSFLGP